MKTAENQESIVIASHGHLDIETPAFVVDESKLRVQVESFKSALRQEWPYSTLSYSVKTNSLPWVVSWMAQNGVWAEVVSDHEYDLAERVGHDPHRIIFNGPVKSKQHLLRALDHGSIINVDSKRELRWLIEIANRDPDRRIAVGVRVNWNVDYDCPNETESAEEHLRFGFDSRNGDLDQAIHILQSNNVSVNGLHFHVSSKTRSKCSFVSAAGQVPNIVSKHGLQLDYIDMGGGFYGGADTSFPSPTDYISAIKDALGDAIDPRTTRLIIEPGAALIAVPVDFHTSVLDTKPVDNHQIIVTDGSRTNIDPFFRKSSYDASVLATGSGIAEKQVISGFTCMDTDRIMTVCGQNELQEGDRIIYHKVGSYTMAFNSLFIHLFPSVYVKHLDGQISQVREPWQLDDFLARHSW